jgi:N-carbamoyl-L-amino-acid hydrolase
MNRRTFAGLVAGAVAGSALDAAPLRALGRIAPPRARPLNAARLNANLKALSAFGANPQGGVSRTAYSDADRAGRAFVMDLMRKAGLDVSVDFAGNIFGRRAGSVASLKPLMFGSHVDSVPDGGNFDGNVGSLAAIEVAQALAEDRTTTRHPIEVVVWANEEGGLYGSRAVSGQLTAAELKNRAWSGKTIEEGMNFLGGNAARVDEVRRTRGDIATYIELHIEQGGTLERDKIQIGVVEGIVGIRRWNLTVTGVQNHAGTTPMDQRQDALLATARFVDMVHRVTRGVPGRQVATVGRVEAFPGAPNVIPGRATATLELRDLDASKTLRVFALIEAEAKRIGEASGTTLSLVPAHESVPAPSDGEVRAMIDDAAKSLGYTARHMPSGAGHDAQSMAQLGPMGMIFIPSIGGISHSPREFSTAEDIARGAEVLMGALRRADARS